ncbi:MAG: hypothetical protein KC944_18530, partial [Candidatus Omnitrophica bacterium]|nr:hypothetical protein [Candidatus Omnitrophota bacterium]
MTQKNKAIQEKRIETPAGEWVTARTQENCDPAALRKDLEAELKGPVRFDDLARAVYSTDASI